jgi:nucleoside-diphosphate-sugar epimerase
MRVVVTGAEGFMGRALAARFAARPDVELFPLGRAALDLQDRPAIIQTLGRIGPQVVIHAAGRTPGRPGALFADNALATANLAEAIGEARCDTGLILLGSAAQYGISNDQRPWRESDPCMPFEPYGVSKQAAETCAFAAARRWGFRAAALRIFNIISSEPQGEQVFAAFLRRAAAAAQVGPPPWRVRMGPLIALRDFVDLDDVLVAVERVIERDAWAEPINVCSGLGRTARSLLSAAAAQTSGAVIVEEDPPTQLPEMPWSVGDPTRCEALLGLRPSTDLAPLTRRAAAWLMTMAKEAAHARPDA